MKNRIKLLAAIRSIAIIALVAVIGFSFTACDDSGDKNKGGTTWANGTWNKSPLQLIVSGNNFTIKNNSVDAYKGTLTLTGTETAGTITINVTHINHAEGWQEVGMPFSDNGTYTATASTLTISALTVDGIALANGVWTKQGGSTVWECACNTCETNCDCIKAECDPVCTCGCDDNGGDTGELAFTLRTNVYGVSKGTSTASEVVIPATYEGLPVTRIERDGFSNYPNLTSITIPSSITLIDWYAFQNTTNLTSITISENVTRGVGGGAFIGWKSSQTINIPFATVEEADTAWGGYAPTSSSSWRYNCNAVIVCKGGSNPNPTTWTAVTNSGFGNGTGENESIYSITWGNGKFIAGSGGYPMAYSSNGTAWTPVTGTTDDEWDLLYSIDKKNSIVWGKDKYVIVTSKATIFYSSNGTTAAWTKVADTAFDYSTSSSVNGIMDVTWGGAAGQEKFVAVGDEGKMAYSSNGINWTPVTDSKFEEARLIRKVVWGNDKFVAVGGAGKMSYSTDGINWEAVADSKMNANYPIYSIAYGNGKFIAAGGNSSNAFMAFSTDGINWTPVTNVPFTSGIINGIAYGNNKFVAVGQNGKAVYSSDCITWTQVINTTFDTTHIQCIAWGNDKFIAGGPGGKMAYWDGN